MPKATGRKEHPLSMRLPEADIDIIGRQRCAAARAPISYATRQSVLLRMC